MKYLEKTTSVLFTFLMIMLVFLAYGSVDNRWYRVVTIEGNSMAPTLWIGDVMVVTPARSAIPLNSIVVMRIGSDLVTHRLVGYDNNGQPITRGDANETPDNWSNPDLKIIGVCRFRLPYIGYPILYLTRLLGRA